MYFRLLRHATLLLGIGNKLLLVDPVLAGKGSQSPIKKVSNQNSNPLVELCVPPDTLADCNAVLVTHTHMDHFDDEAVRLIPKDKQLLCQPQDRNKLIKYGFNNVKTVYDRVNYDGISISRTPARHGYGLTALMLSPVSGFVLSSPGEPTVYITGDSVFYPKMGKVLDMYKPDIIVCYAGEARFASGKPITMGIEDIAKIHRHSPSARIIAVHMESWNHCVLSRKALGKYVEDSNLTATVLIPADGEEIYL